MALATRRYSAIAAFWHWLSVVLIVGQFYTGYVFHQIYERGTPERGEMFMLHKTMGVLILLVALLRVATRLVKPAPALPPSLSDGHRTLAKLSHYAIYAFILVVPLTGLAAISADGGTTELLFGIHWPVIPGVSEALSDLMGEVHEKIVWAFVVLLAVHVYAGLYHHGRGTAAKGRMWPARP